MKHVIVEKRIAGIIRWLERLNKSYSTGEIESALMEAECAKADLETLRRDVWADVQPETVSRRKVLPDIMTVLRPAFLAAVIVLFAVVPLARDLPVPVAAEPVVIASEPQAEEKPEVPVIAAKTESLPKRQQSRKTASVKKPAGVSVKTEQTSAKSVAYDKVFSLMQTGQRALKNNNSVIKVK